MKIPEFPIANTISVHNAAIEMAKRLKLNAEVRACVGKWDENGSIIGWVKSSKTVSKPTVLVEVFVSDLSGEDREFDRYARQMQEVLKENERLRVELAELKKERGDD